MSKIIISLLLLLINFYLYAQKNIVFPYQSDSSFYAQDNKKKVLDYIILNQHREDTIWCEVTERDNYTIHYTTPDKDQWGKDFQDISVCEYRINGKVIHYERPNYLTSDPWEYISPFEDGYAEVWYKTQSRFIDSTGKYESDCPFENIGRFRNGYAWACNKNEYLIINSKCEVKFSIKNCNGERSAAFFDSIIVIYVDGNYGAVNYNFNIIIPHEYSRIHKSSSERYYLIGRELKPKNSCIILWGVYDIVAQMEIVPCSYPEKLVLEKGIGTYAFGDDFLKEVENLKLSIPAKDEIHEKLYP